MWYIVAAQTDAVQCISFQAIAVFVPTSQQQHAYTRTESFHLPEQSAGAE